jgi:outer membrane protein TolC
MPFPERRDTTRIAGPLLIAAALLATDAGAQARPLSLADALVVADARAFANRESRAAAELANGQRRLAWRGILPSVRVEAGFVRTSDPVGAFGTTLRQQRITAADFDPSRLNFPAPLNNHTGALVLEQPLIAVDAWMASRAGGLAAAGAGLAAGWTAISTQSGVLRAWYGVVLAAERATTLEAATRAAHAHVGQAEHMLEAGLVTRSDALLAAVRAGELDASLLEARGDSALSERQLALALGVPGDDVTAAGTFPDDSVAIRVARDVLALPVEPRMDVEGARQGVEAAAADVVRARAAMLPRIVSFARRDLNSTSRPFGGADNWTVGIMASWTPFSGATEIAEQQSAVARRESARARHDGAAAQAQLDVERSTIALQTALARLEIARHAVAQGIEAHRIVARKYAGGLATVVELLDASAAETGARLGLSAARFTLLSAMADRLRAVGAEPARLAVLDNPSGAR